MKIITKYIESPEELYYTRHLKIINPLLPNSLTNREIEVLASFMSIDKNLIEGDRFNVVIRSKIKTKLKLNSGGLSNYIKSLLTKGYLTKNHITNKIGIKDFMFPEEDQQKYNIVLKKEIRITDGD